jgi:hypothetical protein
MSQGYRTSKNKRSKVHFNQYLYNSREPEEDMSNSATEGREDMLRQQSNKNYLIMRRKIRQHAQRLRTR